MSGPSPRQITYTSNHKRHEPGQGVTHAAHAAVCLRVKVLTHHGAAGDGEGLGNHAGRDVDLVEDARKGGAGDVEPVDPGGQHNIGKAYRAGLDRIAIGTPSASSRLKAAPSILKILLRTVGLPGAWFAMWIAELTAMLYVLWAMKREMQTQVAPLEQS